MEKHNFFCKINKSNKNDAGWILYSHYEKYKVTTNNKGLYNTAVMGMKWTKFQNLLKHSASNHSRFFKKGFSRQYISM